MRRRVILLKVPDLGGILHLRNDKGQDVLNIRILADTSVNLSIPNKKWALRPTMKAPLEYPAFRPPPELPQVVGMPFLVGVPSDDDFTIGSTVCLYFVGEEDTRLVLLGLVKVSKRKL